MDLGIAGRSVLITGSSKGIGLACAHAFAAEGCDVHLVARTAEDLERARADIAGRYQVKVTASALDLSDSANVNRLVEIAGDVDILVNNAGAIPGGPIDEIDEARWRAAWDLKVFGYINMTRAFLAKMKARGSGVIVNDIGTGGEKLDYDYIAGAAGNASMMAFTRRLAAGPSTTACEWSASIPDRWKPTVPRLSCAREQRPSSATKHGRGNTTPIGQ